MMRSIRGRLLVWVVGGMSVLLVTFSLVVYGVMQRSITASFDAVLASTARAISATVEQDEHHVKGDIDEREIPDLRRGQRADYFELWLDDGTVLNQSASLKGAHIERFAGAEDALVFRQVRLPDGRPGRAVGLLSRARVEENVKLAAPVALVTLVLERTTAEPAAQIAFLGWFLSFATLGTIAVTYLIGAVVVRQGLKPLDHLAAAIGAIGDQDSAARVSLGTAPAEIAPVIDRLNELLIRLEGAFRRERTFTADAAHELRTPLAGLRSTIEVVLAPADRPREPRHS